MSSEANIWLLNLCSSKSTQEYCGLLSSSVSTFSLCTVRAHFYFILLHKFTMRAFLPFTMIYSGTLNHISLISKENSCNRGCDAAHSSSSWTQVFILNVHLHCTDLNKERRHVSTSSNCTTISAHIRCNQSLCSEDMLWPACTPGLSCQSQIDTWPTSAQYDMKPFYEVNLQFGSCPIS